MVDDHGLSSWTFATAVRVYEHAERCFQLDLSMGDITTVKEIYRMVKDGTISPRALAKVFMASFSTPKFQCEEVDGGWDSAY